MPLMAKQRKKSKASDKAYCLARKKEISARHRTYYLAHKKEMNARSKAYRLTHKKEIAEYQKAYRLAHGKEKTAYRLAHKKEKAEWPKAYCRKYPEKRKAFRRKYRALKYGSNHEPYTEAYIYERDDWMCGICGRKINKRLKRPNLLSKSIDHIIPVSKGGSDSPINVQAAHLRCNMLKRAQSGGQLRLIG